MILLERWKPLAPEIDIQIVAVATVFVFTGLTGKRVKHRTRGTRNLASNPALGKLVVQSPSCPNLHDPMDCSTHRAALSFAISRSLLKLISIESVMPSHHLIMSSPSPPALNLSSIRVFSDELAFCIGWPKDWSFSFSISPSSEYSGLISWIRIDWFDLLIFLRIMKIRCVTGHLHASEASGTFLNYTRFSNSCSVWS